MLSVMPLNQGEREHKARIVFAGNTIQTASGVAPQELFQEGSSAPAAWHLGQFSDPPLDGYTP